jgi:hypothetical protein
MVKRNHVKVLFSPDDRKKLVSLLSILMVVDKQVKAKKHAKKANKSKESKIASSDTRCMHDTIGSRYKKRALSLSSNSLILNEISWTYFIGNAHHVGYHSYYAPQQHILH